MSTTDPSPTSGWLERYKGTSLWKILGVVHLAWDWLRSKGWAPSETNKPGGDGGLQGPK